MPADGPRAVRDPSWRALLASLLAAPAFVGLLWAAGRPLAGASALLALLAGALCVRWALGAVRCLRRCDALRVRVADRVEVTVAARAVEE